MDNSRGLFITVEGMDGSGKTTQIELLKGYFYKKNIPFVCTREPGGTEIGNLIRTILLDEKNTVMHAKTEALLYAAARAQHVEELINPSLKQGKVVLSDRYAHSTLVYQGIARALDWEEMQFLVRFATSGLMPDLTLVLECDLKTAVKRLGKRAKKDRLEEEGILFQEKVKQGYRKLAKESDDSKMHFIDTNDNVTAVHLEIVKILEKIL